MIRDYAGSDWRVATLCSMFARRKWMLCCSECRPKLGLVLQVYPVVTLSTAHFRQAFMMNPIRASLLSYRHDDFIRAAHLLPVDSAAQFDVFGGWSNLIGT